MTFGSSLVVLIVAGVLAAGNACAQRRSMAVSDTTPSYETEWATVQPPRGSSWYVMERSSRSASFFKSLGARRHTFTVVAWTRNIPGCCKDAQELLGQVRKEMADARTLRRFRYQSQDFAAVSWDDLACVQTRMVADDYGVISAPGEAFTFFHKGIICAQPGATGTVIEASYSERGGMP